MGTIVNLASHRRASARAYAGGPLTLFFEAFDGPDLRLAAGYAARQNAVSFLSAPSEYLDFKKERILLTGRALSLESFFTGVDDAPLAGLVIELSTPVALIYGYRVLPPERHIALLYEPYDYRPRFWAMYPEKITAPE